MIAWNGRRLPRLDFQDIREVDVARARLVSLQTRKSGWKIFGLAILDGAGSEELSVKSSPNSFDSSFNSQPFSAQGGSLQCNAARQLLSGGLGESSATPFVYSICLCAPGRLV